jgi:hypothetical protein
MVNDVPTYTMTCASCHFGQTPDGRYVVGQPNHRFAASRYVLTVSTLPELALGRIEEMAPEVEAVVGPVRDEVFASEENRDAVRAQALAVLPNVVATKTVPPDDAARLAMALNPPGVMDPYSLPSLDDRVPIPVRMSPLWGIDQAAMEAAGSTHGAMLGSNGGAPDLQHIMRTFACIAGKLRALPLCESYDPAKVQPLIEYILSLRPPPPEEAPDPERVAAGAAVFREHCFRCHDGPGFATTQVHDPREIGTDPNISRLVDPDGTGRAIDDVLTPPELTRGVRARRLTAVWSLGRLFHNGSASSLAEVFCLDGPRPASTLGPGHGTAGHDFTCRDLSTDEKHSVMAFLESL